MSEAKWENKAMVLVLDGFGFDPVVEQQICLELHSRMSDSLRKLVDAVPQALALAVFAPPGAGLLASLSRQSGLSSEDFRTALEELAGRLSAGDPDWWGSLPELRRTIAEELHYAPWAASTPFLDKLRMDNPTWVTRTAGVYAGFDDMSPGPEAMGNSDTGHQQLFNLTVAQQIPAKITSLVDQGMFYELQALNQDLIDAARTSTVVFKTLLSGEFGDDGYVHSAWKHMEAFFELYFNRLGLPVDSLQLEIVLDGRDSPRDSSIQTAMEGEIVRFGFLPKLINLLKRHGAEQVSGWLLGRQFLDRDYKGGMIRQEYELLAGNKGAPTRDWTTAVELVRGHHAEGLTDAMIPPIVVGAPRPLSEGMLHFNAIFRADRQEPITACLAGAMELLNDQASSKGKLDTWDGFTWLKDLSGVTLWSMIQYNRRLEGRVKAVFQDSPHEHNVLHLLNQRGAGFRFLFLTEGVKEKHMGMFSRGRRSAPLAPSETQVIISSWGREDGVDNDNQFFRVPQMRHPEITARLLQELEAGSWPLICANYPGADMLGHLIMDHFDACVGTLHSLDQGLTQVVPAAREKGYAVIITADHGNVDNYSPAHGNHDVLTTIVLPGDLDLVPARIPGDQARLFDVSWTLLKLLDVPEEELVYPPIPRHLSESKLRLVGTSLLSRP